MSGARGGGGGQAWYPCLIWDAEGSNSPQKREPRPADELPAEGSARDHVITAPRKLERVGDGQGGVERAAILGSSSTDSGATGEGVQEGTSTRQKQKRGIGRSALAWRPNLESARAAGNLKISRGETKKKTL